MSRLPRLTREQLDEQQTALWDSITGSKRARADRGAGGPVGPDGALVGPFNAFLFSPAVGRPAADLGAAIRFETGLESRLLELAIITVGAHWRSNFEFQIHGRYAIDAGVGEDVVAALAEGRVPSFENDDEKAVHDFCSSMLENGRVADTCYSAVRDLVGESGVVELVSALGYYSLVCFDLNAFRVPGLPDEPLVWPEEA